MRRGEKDLQPVTSNPGSLTSALTTSDSSSGNSDGTSSDSESDSAAKQAAVLKGTSEEFQAWYKALPDAQKATVLTLKEGVLKKLQSKKLSAKARSAIIKSATNVAAVKANEEVVCYAQIIIFQEQPTNNTQRKISRRVITQMKIPPKGS